jgi:hypothetical protein
LSWHLTGLASLSSAKVMAASSIVTTFALSQGHSHKLMIHSLWYCLARRWRHFRHVAAVRGTLSHGVLSYLVWEADTRLIPRSCFGIAWHVQNDKLSSSAISLIVKHRFPQITALTRSTVSLVRAVYGRPVCGSWSMDMRPFLNRKYYSNILDRLNAVSPNACCSISYVSVAVLPSFWQNLVQTRCSFSTSVSQYDRGTITIALLINSLTTESNCNPLLWCVASGGVAKYPTCQSRDEG